MIREHHALHSVPASSPPCSAPPGGWMGWGGSSLCSQPEDPHQGTLPAPPMDSTQSPALRGAPTAHLGWRTPTWEGRGGGKGHPPPPHHSLPIKTLILFLISQWKGGMSGTGRGGGVILSSPPPLYPGCVEVVRSHCRALYVLDYCSIFSSFISLLFWGGEGCCRLLLLLVSFR